jgi:2-octaprenyl-6-methoxyphenol hydroxylase
MSNDAPAWRIAVVGAGPAGLALALLAARRLPLAEVTTFDARPLDADVAADPRTLALALGSVQLLDALRAWPARAAQPIVEVRVSQAQPSPLQAEVCLRAVDEAVPMLGAVTAYGTLVASLQQAWLKAVAAAPQRLHARFGTPVAAVKPLADAVEVDAGIAERFDLAVIAEGGLFADQARKPIRSDYRQLAWVGTATLEGATPGRAIERFTRDGPLALLPLPPAGDGSSRAALVWCVSAAEDQVGPLDERQRIAVLNSLLPGSAGRVTGLTALKSFPLGLNAERTLVDGRIVRIGNAAQTLHPVAGQGLNLGLRDVARLVQALRTANPVHAARALRRLDWAHAPDRWSTIAITDFLARGFAWRTPGLRAARGLALAALEALPPLKSALARQMMFGRR